MIFIQILTPFLLASFGGLYSELSGYTNVSLEGYISLGGFIFIAITMLTGSTIIGITASLILLVLLSILQGVITITIKANPIITGLATNLGISGIISILSFKLFNTKGVIALTRTEEYKTGVLTIISLIIPIATYIILKYTRYGLRLKAHGINKKVLIYSGIKSNYYRISSMVISALFAGLGGLYLAMELRSYTPNLSGGRGWLSLVIIFLGRKSSVGISLSAILFTITIIISNKGQTTGIPGDLVLAIPYTVTLLALIISRINCVPSLLKKVIKKN